MHVTRSVKKTTLISAGFAIAKQTVQWNTFPVLFAALDDVDAQPCNSKILIALKR
jgi:hypothetical protein